MSFEVHLAGVSECLSALGSVSDAIKRKYVRIALNAAGGQLKQGAVSRVPLRTKLLKQSLAVKVSQKKNGEWYTVIGAKRGMRRALRQTQKGTTRALGKRATSNLKFTPGEGNRQYYNPARTLHLVEKGTRSHVVSVKNKQVLAGNGGIWGRSVAISAKGSHFLADTAQASGQAALQRGIDKIKELIKNHKPDAYYRDERGQFKRRA